MRLAIFGLLSLVLTAPPAAAQDREVIQMPGALEGLPFSSAVRVGNLLYLSGSIGVVPGTRDLAPGGIEGQTRQTMENIGAVLEYAGSSFARVVKCTVFLVGMENYAGMNAVYASFFPENPPARSTTGATELALGALVEIECIATVGNGS